MAIQRAGYVLFSNEIVEKQVETRLTKTFIQILVTDPPATPSPDALPLVTINGTMYDQLGNPVTTGRLSITPSNFITLGTYLISPVTVTYTVANPVNLQLVPSNGVLYKVIYDPTPADTDTPVNLKPGYWLKYWNIPGTGPVNIASL